MEHRSRSRTAQLGRKAVKSMVSRAGYELRSKGAEEPLVTPFDDDRHKRIFGACEPFTMTSRRRIYAVIDAVDYIVENRVPGALVECGVWRGGSAMAMVMTLLDHGIRDREVHLFDTFSGMTPPSPLDSRFDGASAERLMREQPDHYVCAASLEDVRRNMDGCGYPGDRIHYVEGPVQETIPSTAPAAIALLRLDTDWYESTFHELEHLYPRITPQGVLIVDDYGYWQGARDACEDYFRQSARRPFLSPIDDTGVIGVSIPAPHEARQE